MNYALAVLGRPIAHSLTPPLMDEIARARGDAVTCPRIDCGEAELAATVRRLAAEGIRGFNCTMPLKTEMSALCRERSFEAEILCSVNSVRVAPDGSFSGITTDGAGMVAAVTEQGGQIAGREIVLLGAGGAARSIALSLCRAGAARLTVCNRTVAAAQSLANMLRRAGCTTAVATAPLDAESVADAARSAALLVNATSCGMAGSADFPDLSFLTALPAGAAVADAVYHPRETALLRAAAGRGLLTVPGIYMLIWQGVLAYDFFTGVSLPFTGSAAVCRALSAL